MAKIHFLCLFFILVQRYYIAFAISFKVRKSILIAIVDF